MPGDEQVVRLPIAGRVLLAALCGAAMAGAVAAAEARLTVEADVATVGDRIGATLRLDMETGETFEPSPLGSELGPFSVEGGAWSAPSDEEDGRTWVWTGELVAFRTGALEIPSIELSVEGSDGPSSVSTEPRSVTIESVLTDEDLAVEQPEIADLKPAASIAPRYGPLWAALGGLLLLLAAAAVLWWLHRRYAARLAAVPAPTDPFQRTPPHVWIYAELKKLLGRKLAEQGQVDRFYAELARILKIYLGGRYRVDLLEHTTEEVPERLRQAGAAAVDEVTRLLDECDRVKFARHRPESTSWREAVEQVYRIVDSTKPAGEADHGVQRGAA